MSKPNINRTSTFATIEGAQGKRYTLQMSADLTRVYTVSRQLPVGGPAGTLSAMPHAADDVSKEHGISIYEKMACDGEVSAAIDALVESACNTPTKVRSSIQDESNSDYRSARFIADYCQWMIDRIPNFKQSRKQMISDGLIFGTSVSSLTFGYVSSGPYKDALRVERILPNPLRATLLIVDEQAQVVGVVPSSPSQVTWWGQGMTIPINESKRLDDVIPRSKFAVLAWNPPTGDARGRSILRSTFTPWWIKQKTIESMLQWCEKYAWPSLFGTTADGATSIEVCDDDGNVISVNNPIDNLHMALSSFGNGSVLAAEHGTAIQMLQVQGDAQSFLNIIAWANNEIVRSIQNQHLATAEGQHQARAAADVHKDVLTIMIVAIKEWFCDMILNDIIRPIVEANFPAFTHLMPKIDLGDGTGFRLTVQDIASLAAVDWFTEEQKREIDTQLGVPQR